MASISNHQTELKENIRYLGRVLGATIKAKDGEAIFDVVETIRKTAIKFHRDNDQAANELRENLFKSLRQMKPLLLYAHLAILNIWLILLRTYTHANKHDSMKII